jgi:hypothetical protein
MQSRFPNGGLDVRKVTALVAAALVGAAVAGPATIWAASQTLTLSPGDTLTVSCSTRLTGTVGRGSAQLSCAADTPTPGTATPTAVATSTPTPRTPTPAPPTATAVPRTATPTVAPPTATPPSSGGGIWRPALDTSWQWQLTGTVDQSVDATMYDIDLFDNSASVVASLHARGRKVVCYLSAGTWEDWRPDAAQFPADVKGSGNGWPGEKWLDIRRLDVLGPIMQARLDQCKAKGFDAVEPDNIDGYTNSTGFPLTAQDQLRYNTFLADAAHARGLSIGLKNDLDQVGDLVSVFDWALNEQCFQYKECSALSTFVNAGKAVFNVEYSLSTSQFCPQANSLNFNSLKKNEDLDASRVACR